MANKKNGIFVTKYDGSLQAFDREKILQTCVKMGAAVDVANSIASRVEGKVYDGISTKKILNMIFFHMKKHRPELKHTIDLRKAITMLRPKPDFEIFIAQIFRAMGYKVKSNQYVKGKCVEYEIDAIAVKGKETLFIEVKHHYKPHTYTGLDVFLETMAKMEDLIDGYKVGNNKIKFTDALVVCNTKISDHGKMYAKCRGINVMGWKSPKDEGLERIIESRKLYPTTFLKNLTQKEQNMLGDAGIVTVKQIVEMETGEISRRSHMPKKRVKELASNGREVLSS